MQKITWRWRNIFCVFTFLWATWIFGVIWKYYKADIVLNEGLTLFGLMFFVIIFTEASLGLQKKTQGEYYEKTNRKSKRY